MAGWFVNIRMPEPAIDGVWMSMTVGPFVTRDDCSKYRLLMLRAFAVFDDAVIGDCKQTI